MGLIQSSGKKQVDSTPTAATTFNAAANFTAGNTVIIDLVHFGPGSQRITAITVSGTSAVKDSEVTDLGASNNHSEVWRASNIAGGSSAVVITTGAAIGQYITCGFEERDDVGENPLDKIGSTTDTTSAAPSVTSAAATNTPDQIVYAGFCDSIGTNWTSATPPTGYTETWEEVDGTTHEAGSGAYKVETTAGSKTALFATGASMSWIAAMATYRIAIGGNVLAYRFLGGSATSYTTGAFTTQASGGTMLVCVGRGTLSDHVLPTDNKSNTYTQYDSNRAYTAWPTSGTALYAKTSFAGGTGHTITVGMTTTNDEVTILAVECPGYTTIVDQQWNEDLTTGTNTSSSVTTTGAAMLVAFWWGADSNGELLPAVPADWTLLKHTSSLASNHVQGAVAYKRVTGAGTYSIVWTPSTAQAAQLRIVALQAGGAPVITVQPVSQTVPAGAAANFSITETGATSWQWEQNDGAGWGNVSGGSGGTTNSYTAPVAVLATMNGRRYRCNAINASGTTVSSEAQLWVTIPVPIGMFDPLIRSECWFDELFA